MNIRKTGPVLIIVAFGGISPALADCCSSVWDCAAAAVTDGLSCEVETIISTIKNLVNLVSNMANDVTGQTQNAERAARQLVSDTINTMQSQSQQSAADLAQARTQADLIYHEETAPRDLKMATANPTGNLQTTSPTTPSAQSPGLPTATINHTQNIQAASQTATAKSGLPLRELAQQRPTGAPLAPQDSAPPGNPLQKSTVTARTQDAVSIESQLAPHGSYAEAFSRGLKQITLLNATGATELGQVNQYLATAQASEGPGVAAADTLAAAMNAPLNDIESQLSSMLANPLSAFDPTSVVDSIENSVTANMSGNISKMIDDISAGPEQAFNAATPTFDELLQNAEKAQAIAAAMDRLYTQRTPGAAIALDALLPKEQYASLNTKETAVSHLTTNFGRRLSSAQLKSKRTTGKQTILLAVKAPNLQPIHTAVAQFKALRAQGKSAQAPSMVQTYRTNVSRQFDGYFAGKSPAGIATQRDQLIAEARTRFAKDPRTENGVIGLINSEAEKHGAARNAAIPGQPVPGMTTAATAKSASPAAMVHAVTEVKPAPSTTTSAPQACNKVGNKLPCVCVTGSNNNPTGCTVMGWDVTKNRVY